MSKVDQASLAQHMVLNTPPGVDSNTIYIVKMAKVGFDLPKTRRIALNPHTRGQRLSKDRGLVFHL